MTAAPSLLIRNARVIDPHDGYDAVGCLAVRGGRISYRGAEAPNESFEQTLDAAVGGER